MKTLLTGILAGTVLFAATGAIAQEPSPGRYAMQKTETGIARLDTQTGEVSLCREADGQMLCQMAADERAAFELELDLLTKRIEKLEKTVQGGQAPLGPETSFKPRLPSQEEIDQTLTVMERMMRSFMGIVKGLEGGDATQPSTGQGDVPDRT